MPTPEIEQNKDIRMMASNVELMLINLQKAKSSLLKVFVHDEINESIYNRLESAINSIGIAQNACEMLQEMIISDMIQINHENVKTKKYVDG